MNFLNLLRRTGKKLLSFIPSKKEYSVVKPPIQKQPNKTRTEPKTAIILMYIGGAKCLDEVPCLFQRIFLDKMLAYGCLNRTKRLKALTEMLPVIMNKYGSLPGRKSPALIFSKSQAHHLKEKMNATCIPTAPHEVIVANQFVRPSIADALRKIQTMECLENVIVLPMTPQYSCGLTGGGLAAIHKFYATNPFPEKLRWMVVDSWATSYTFMRHTAYAAQKAISKSPDKSGKPKTVIFAGQPLPDWASNVGDFYPYFVGSSLMHVMRQLRFAHDYTLAWDTPLEKKGWFKPTVEDALKGYVCQGKKSFILVPLTTATDNFVTYYYYDIRLRKHVLPKLGKDISLTRVCAPNDSKMFIDAVADVCKEAILGKNVITHHITKRCVLCKNNLCRAYKRWYKRLIDKGIIR